MAVASVASRGARGAGGIATRTSKRSPSDNLTTPKNDLCIMRIAHTNTTGGQRNQTTSPHLHTHGASHALQGKHIVAHKELGMKKLRVKGLRDRADCATIVQRCMKTVDGYENVHINTATGEITYTPGTCVDEEILKEALAQEGLTVEEMK